MNASHGFGAGLLAVSLGLNALLGIACTNAWSKLLRPVGVPPPPSAARASVPTQRLTEGATPASMTAPAAEPTPQIPWRQVESDDYRVYAANLRSIGCPEWLVREILVADIEKLYEQRSRSVSKRREYWIGGGRWRALGRAEEDQRAALSAEKRALVRELVGYEWDAKAAKTWNDDLWDDIPVITVLLGAFAESKPVQLIAFIEQYEQLSDELKRKADNILLPADEASLKALSRSLQTELGSVLGPAELGEFEVRLESLVTLMDGLHIEGVELTGAELREMMRLRAAIENPLHTLIHKGRGLPDEEQAEIDAGLRQLLGETRFVDLQRAQDGNYREVLTFTQAQGLPKQVAAQVHDLRAAAEQEVGRLQQDQSLTPEQRANELITVQATAAEAVARTLGASALQEYMKQHGGWLEGLAKLPEGEGSAP